MSSGKHLTGAGKRNVGLIKRMRLRLSCVLGNHEPNRNRVRRTTDMFYVGVCRHCGTTIRKRHGHPWKACSPDEWNLARDDQSASIEKDLD